MFVRGVIPVVLRVVSVEASQDWVRSTRSLLTISFQDAVVVVLARFIDILWRAVEPTLAQAAAFAS